MKILLLLLVLSFPTMVFSQRPPKQEADLSRLADELFASQDQDINYEELYENIAQLISHPINLNRASSDELQFLNVLSDQDVQNIIRYRTTHGDFLSAYELQAVDGLDPALIQHMLPFIEVPDTQSAINASLLRRMTKKNNTYIVARYSTVMEKKAGDTNEVSPDQQFQGSRNAYYLRFRNSRPGDFSVGFTAEKDAGEKLRWQPSEKHFGADYLSFHLQLQNKGRLKNLIIGDYQYQFAQGILLGGSFGFGKGGETITAIRKSNIGFTPYTSANESFFLRGVATTYTISPRISLSLFYSRTASDASVVDEDGLASSLLTNGLHRNKTELAKRKQLGEQNYGGVIRYTHNQLDAGILFTSVQFDTKLAPTVRSYNQFVLRGSQYQNTGFFLNYTLRNISIFSEAAKTLDAGFAGAAGMLVSLTSRLDISMVYRHYDRDFTSRYSNAFAESSTPQNEKGVYWGWKYKLNRRYNVSGYFDLFAFPWLRYRSYAPANGHEWLLRFQHQPNKRTNFVIQGRQEVKPRNTSIDTVRYLTADGTKRSFWMTMDKAISNKIKTRSRCQYSTYSFAGRTTAGLVVAQDVSFDVGRLSCTVRSAWFSTDDFDNRQYVYENDVWMAYAMPAYYGKGMRFYTLVSYSLTRHLTLWLRYGRTQYRNQESIGSGVDAIAGNTRNDIKFQIRCRF